MNLSTNESRASTFLDQLEWTRLLGSLPLKDKISLLQYNIESYLQETVVQSVTHVVLLQDVSLSAGTGSSVLGQVHVNKPDLAEIFPSLLLLPYRDPTLARVQDTRVIVRSHLAGKGKLLVILDGVVDDFLSHRRLLETPSIELADFGKENGFPECDFCEFI